MDSRYPVFIETINSNQMARVKEIISKNGGYLVDDKNYAKFIITKDIFLNNYEQYTVQTISLRCLYMMDNELVNPFKFDYTFICYINIFLKNKTFSFYNVDKIQLKQCSILVQMMGGKIINEYPDYFLCDKNSIPTHSNCVEINWIYALQYSKRYISPVSFSFRTQHFQEKNHFQLPIEKYTQEIGPTKFDYSIDFIFQAKKIQKDKKLSYKALKTEMEHTYVELRKENFEDFEKEIKMGAINLNGISKKQGKFGFYNTYMSDASSCIKKTMTKSSILMNSVPCGSVRHQGRWIDCEERQLLFVLNEGSCTGSIFNERGRIDWLKVASKIPGRTLKSCQDKYHQMLTNGIINDIEIERNDPIPENQFNKMIKKSLYPQQEEELYEKIITRLDRGELITPKDISLMALDYFYSPVNLAIKCIVTSYLNKKQWPFNSEGNVVTALIDKEMRTILDWANESPDELMDKYNIKKFIASPSWTYKFMRRHNLSFRAAHYERRGSINPDEVDHFLSCLADILVRYEPKFIFNMDETFIYVFNNPVKVIAKKGQGTVKIEKERHDKKEGTTYLGTISMDPAYTLPLFIIAKGESEV